MSAQEESEIKDIKHILEEGEKVLVYATQSRLKPGGNLVTPNKIYATNKRIIIRNPTMLGLRSSIEYYGYDKIAGVKVQKGLFSSMVYLTIPGRTELSRTSSLLQWGRRDEAELAALPKKLADDFANTIRDGINNALHGQIDQKKNLTDNSDNPLKILNVRYAKGEIDKKEYEQMKKDLIG